MIHIIIRIITINNNTTNKHHDIITVDAWAGS